MRERVRNLFQQSWFRDWSRVLLCSALAALLIAWGHLLLSPLRQTADLSNDPLGFGAPSGALPTELVGDLSTRVFQVEPSAWRDPETGKWRTPTELVAAAVPVLPPGSAVVGGAPNSSQLIVRSQGKVLEEIETYISSVTPLKVDLWAELRIYSVDGVRDLASDLPKVGDLEPWLASGQAQQEGFYAGCMKLGTWWKLQSESEAGLEIGAFRDAGSEEFRVEVKAGDLLIEADSLGHLMEDGEERLIATLPATGAEGKPRLVFLKVTAIALERLSEHAPRAL